MTNQPEQQPSNAPTLNGFTRTSSHRFHWQESDGGSFIIGGVSGFEPFATSSSDGSETSNPELPETDNQSGDRD
jgi:hypothetical protein